MTALQKGRSLGVAPSNGGGRRAKILNQGQNVGRAICGVLPVIYLDSNRVNILGDHQVAMLGGYATEFTCI